MSEWRKDGDPCNDCGQPARYNEAISWYEHIDPNAPVCFLMGSREEAEVDDDRGPDIVGLLIMMAFAFVMGILFGYYVLGGHA